MLRVLQRAFTAFHTAVYRASKGRVFGGFRATRFLLLHTTGRKSGKERVTPLNYVRDGDDFVLIASNGGATRHPDWYLNLQARADAAVEVEGRTIPVVADTVTGDARDRLWGLAVESWKSYDAYQRRTDREIPVVRLRPARD